MSRSAWRGAGEEEPEAVQVVMGGKQETDLRLADGARARVDRPDVQAPAEEPVELSPASLAARRSSSCPGTVIALLTCHRPEWGPASRDGARGGRGASNTPLAVIASGAMR